MLELWCSLDFPGGSDGKASAYNVGDPGLIPGSGRSPGEGNGNSLQYSCLENPGKSHGKSQECGRLQSMGSQRVGHDWVTSLSISHRFQPQALRTEGLQPGLQTLRRLGPVCFPVLGEIKLRRNQASFDLRCQRCQKMSKPAWVTSGWLLHPTSSPSWPNKLKCPHSPLVGFQGRHLSWSFWEMWPHRCHKDRHIWLESQLTFNWVISVIKIQENGYWGFWWDWVPGSCHTEWTQW